jgi:hypothetical protein
MLVNKEWKAEGRVDLGIANDKPYQILAASCQDRIGVTLSLYHLPGNIMTLGD